MLCLTILVSANQESQKAEVSRLKLIIADLESYSTNHASTVGLVNLIKCQI